MTYPAVRPPDAQAHREAVARHARLAVPLGGLGLLAELGCRLAAWQGTSPPRPPARPRVLVVAADHGIAVAGVSRHTVTRPQVTTLQENGAAVAVLATVGGASVRLVDAGLGRPSGRIDREDARTAEAIDQALELGRTVVDEEVDAGADLLVPGSLGAGATTPAAVLVAALTGAEPVAVVGRGSGIDDATWMRKAAAIRDALRRARPHVRDPIALLRTVGGADLAVLTGILLQAAVRQTPVLLDGLVVGAAAMVADELAPGARDWWLVAQRSPEPAMTLATEHLDLPPLLDLGIRAADGTGALTALPLLQMAARLLAETAVDAELPDPTRPDAVAPGADGSGASSAVNPGPTASAAADPAAADPGAAVPGTTDPAEARDPAGSDGPTERDRPTGPDRPGVRAARPASDDPVGAALSERVPDPQ